jgi:trans-2,3-dihydro-3-hydroxyanthranilate isomerase
MFAPAMNIVEDPATGAAAAALAAYLGMREPGPSGTYRWTVEQGIEMGRPSMLDVEADKEHGSMTAIRVGGRAVMVAEAVMTIPATSDQSPVAS